jgi:hypothetical protein
VIGVIIYFALVLQIPEMRQLLEEQLRQSDTSGLTTEDLEALIGIMGPVAGICFGVLNIFLTFAASALGGWIAVRQRQGQQPPMAPPPLAVPPA